MGAFLEVDGFFSRAEAWLAARAGTRQRLLAWVVWPSGALSALVTNDAVAVLAAPMVLRLCERLGLPAAPYLVALALSVNTGSAATLVGNPQNMLCAVLGGLSYRDYLVQAGPVALVGLAVGQAVVAWVYRADLRGALPAAPAPAPMGPRVAGSLATIAGVAVVATLGADLAWTAAGGFALLMVAHRRDTSKLWVHVDWPLLLFFAGLFVVVEGLQATGAPAWVFARYPLSTVSDPVFALISLVGCNVVSNVPYILVVEREVVGEARWSLLALVSTFAGNLTLLGSVANLIVAAASGGRLGCWEHATVGIPVTLVTTLAAVGAAAVGWM